MSSDSDSDVCDFSSDLNKFMSRAQDKFWKNLKEKKQDEKTPEENNAPVPEPEAQDFTIIDESGEAEKSASVNDRPVENVHSDEIIVVNVSAPLERRDSNACGSSSIVNKLNALSETVQDILKDSTPRGKRKRASRGRKRPAPPVRRWSLRRRFLNNIVPFVPLLMVDNNSDDEVIPIQSPRNETQVLPENTTELNPTLEIKILWKSLQDKVFKVKKFQGLQCIHEYFISEVKVNPKLLFFTVDDKPVDLQDNSYVSLRLSDTKFIEGGVLPESYLNNPVSYPKFSDKDLLKFKVQFMAGRKKELGVTCKQSDKIDFILWQIIKEVKMPVENVRLYFDGQLLKGSDSVSDLGLEDGDCFDLQVI